MPICNRNLRDAITLLGKDEARSILMSANKVDRIEASWKSKLQSLFEKYDKQVTSSLLDSGKIPNLDFVDFYFHHAMAVSEEAVKTASTQQEITSKIHLSSSPPPPKLPRTLSKLQDLWDMYRKKGQVPRRVQVLSDRVKKAYVKKCQSVWDKYSRDFRSGKKPDMHEALKVIKKASDGVYSRAKMIVETETTNYYNRVRRATYDESPDVTHYLFLSIRDNAVTKWCSTRHRLVYAKDDPLTDSETPAIHWNCRSEMVPLSKYNPRHARIIADKSKWRRNRNPEPLPVGWRK